MEYKAIFDIDGGISPGFGLKSPYHEERDETIIADTNESALVRAAGKAVKISMDYLSNPKNDFTTVKLLSLQDSQGNSINQRETLRKEGYDGVKKFEWEGDILVTKAHMLEHLLSL